MKNLCYLLILTLFFSCSKDIQNEKLILNENDSLVFIRFNSEGQYIYTFYKLTNSEVFRNDTYFTYINQFEYYYNEDPANLVNLGSDKFNLSKDLIHYFPNQLLSTERKIGNPGALDGGVLYLKLTKNGVTKTWELDSDPNAVPEEFRVFVQKVNEKINQL